MLGLSASAFIQRGDRPFGPVPGLRPAALPLLTFGADAACLLLRQRRHSPARCVALNSTGLQTRWRRQLIPWQNSSIKQIANGCHLTVTCICCIFQRDEIGFIDINLSGCFDHFNHSYHSRSLLEVLTQLRIVVFLVKVNKRTATSVTSTCRRSHQITCGANEMANANTISNTPVR